MMILKSGVPKLRIDELAFTPDGSGIVAPAGSNGVCYWKTLTGDGKAEVLTLPAKVVKRLVFAPDGRTLYAGSDQLCAFDLAGRTGTVLDIPKWASLWFGVSPDGKRLAVAEAPKDTAHTRLTLWATDSLAGPLREVLISPIIYSQLQFTPSGERFVLLESEHLPSFEWQARYVWRASDTLEAIEDSDPLPEMPDQMILSPDGSLVACRLRDTITLYRRGGRRVTIKNDGKKQFTGMAFHPSGRTIAATNNDKTVKVYGVESSDLIRTFSWEIGRTRSVAFSPDGAVAAAGSDTGKVVVWDVDE
jgi:WD40 repeat protein